MSVSSRGRAFHEQLQRIRRAPLTAQVNQSLDDLFQGLLDESHRKLRDPALGDEEFHAALDEAILALHARRLDASENEWRQFVAFCRRHPLKDLLHEDPFTSRAFLKPRGYPGDAELMDYIYGREEHWPCPPASVLGQRVFNYTTLAPAPEGVRARRGFVADLIDRVAEEGTRPHVLSIAAGHLREANLACAVKRRRLGRFVALDADATSLAEVERCYGQYGVEVIPARFRRLLLNRLDIGKYDLVYSTGLFDYLDATTGRRLLRTMFDLLRPGGQVVVANFLPGIRDLGYMEVFMDWQLVYRTRQEMIDITMEIPQDEIRQISLFAEENRNIIFLQIRKQ